MVVVLAVRIIFRLDKAAGGLDPLVGPREASVGRWPASLTALSLVRRISKLSCGQIAPGEGEREDGQGKTVKRSVRNGLFDVQVKAQYTPTNPPSVTHVSFPFRKGGKG